jgi:hypothetical protein
VRTPEGVAAARGTEFADNRHNNHHYVFVAKGSVWLYVDGKLYELLKGTGAQVGSGVMPPATDVDQVLREILEILQPFNIQALGVLDRIDNGTATEADIAYYNSLKDSYFPDNGDGTAPYDPMHPNDFAGPITSTTGFGGAVFSPVITPYDWDYNNILPTERRAVDQDLEPFGTNPLTPF